MVRMMLAAVTARKERTAAQMLVSLRLREETALVRAVEVGVGRMGAVVRRMGVVLVAGEGMWEVLV